MTSLAQIKKNSKIDMTEWTDEEIIDNVLKQKNDIIDNLLKKIEELEGKNEHLLSLVVPPGWTAEWEVEE